MVNANCGAFWPAMERQCYAVCAQHRYCFHWHDRNSIPLSHPRQSRTSSFTNENWSWECVQFALRIALSGSDTEYFLLVIFHCPLAIFISIFFPFNCSLYIIIILYINSYSFLRNNKFYKDLSHIFWSLLKLRNYILRDIENIDIFLVSCCKSSFVVELYYTTRKFFIIAFQYFIPPE